MITNCEETKIIWGLEIPRLIIFDCKLWGVIFSHTKNNVTYFVKLLHVKPLRFFKRYISHSHKTVKSITFWFGRDVKQNRELLPDSLWRFLKKVKSFGECAAANSYMKRLPSHTVLNEYQMSWKILEVLILLL